MRRLSAILILLCITYFIGGWIAVHFGLFDKDVYFSYAGIVGGLASVVGLFAFTKPALTKTDLQEIEMDSLRSIAKTTDELRGLEETRAKTKEELGDLAVQKKAMELLVKKASLALFLKEQYSHLEKKVIEEVSSNTELNESLEKLKEVSQKLNALNEEIDRDPNVSQLKDILSTASRREPTLDDAIEQMPSIAKLTFIVIREMGLVITNLTRAIK
ncbi:hypothetical protein L2755_04610 [Shewanella abyssi]|uniref:hypothetical protein n=1 Tax=Shewanella abyssi TaxID=311789 RepID=UPI00201029C2|nr:hypothetical protein [Shewanella abyssi]MCL1048911.1 hypothetical protein [Shewanella abyssi]